MTSGSRLRQILGRVHRIDHVDPTLTAQNWVERQPVRRVGVGGGSVVISQPTSTFWVYALGVLTCVVAARYWSLVPGERATQLWSIGLWLWGIGALLAGTSYQAFGYHLKCRDGRVRWTNWWEVTYMICQQVSVQALLASTALFATSGVRRDVLVGAAIVTAVAFTTCTLVAAVVPNRWLLSFEWMSLTSTPAVLAMAGIHAVALASGGDGLDRALLGIWVGLFACGAAYWAWWRSGIGDRLWARGRWFSENDVLHVTLIVWVLAIAAIDDRFVERLAG